MIEHHLWRISRCDYNLEDPHFVATRSNASSREAGGSRTPGLSGGDLSQDTPAPIFLGIAMSTRKTSLTDKQTKNGTSKYVLERCASINEYYDIAFKVMLLGDSSVGKTCVLVRFKDGAFLGGNFIATVGIDFRNKVVDVDNLKVKLQAWLTEIHEYAQKDVVIMLLGNKSDMAAERVVKTEDGERLAKEYGVPFMETSAKTGVNVELAFLAIAKELKHRATQQPSDPKFQIHDYIESQKQKSGCCGLV
ncbi:Ras-related protein Rab-37 [Larimichthys crocea]|uniref:Uncharacterized protein n=1 Tax=Larimichthys crocea TaxID=215358 RepID=A0ACD3R815_LARCR|nr:Ras-related protein Rab-37 [Larimichthys crocea]